MKSFSWNSEKNRQLQLERGVSFEQVLQAIIDGSILDVIEYPNQDRYPSQRIFIVEINQYAYLVPFVEKLTRDFPQDNHSQPQNEEEILGRVSYAASRC